MTPILLLELQEEVFLEEKTFKHLTAFPTCPTY